MSTPVPLATAIARRSLAYAQGLAQAHANGSMNSLVLITRPGSDTFNETTREYGSGLQTVIYDDPDNAGAGAIAGVTLAQGPITMDLGDEPQYYSSITAYIPQQVPKLPRINDLLEIKANPDPDMVGRRFRIVDVPAGGRISASIALSCTGIAPSKEWLAP